MRGLALFAKAAAVVVVGTAVGALYGLLTLARLMDEAEQELT